MTRILTFLICTSLFATAETVNETRYSIEELRRDGRLVMFDSTEAPKLKKGTWLLRSTKTTEVNTEVQLNAVPTCGAMALSSGSDVDVIFKMKDGAEGLVKMGAETYSLTVKSKSPLLIAGELVNVDTGNKIPVELKYVNSKQDISIKPFRLQFNAPAQTVISPVSGESFIAIRRPEEKPFVGATISIAGANMIGCYTIGSAAVSTQLRPVGAFMMIPMVKLAQPHHEIYTLAYGKILRDEKTGQFSVENKEAGFSLDFLMK